MSVDIVSICFNEELLLPIWIESWLSLSWVNRIYLVDGGSTDRSSEIVKNYDRVSILTVPWKNDFSRQRNIAIKLGKADWIMQPDIDEIPCGQLKDDRLEASLKRVDINQIVIPYVKFYDWKTLWFFKDGNTPYLNDNLVKFGTKSTMTIFKKGHLTGYSKSLHEMPIFAGNEKLLRLGYSRNLDGLGNGFMLGHYDQAKHFEQAKRNETSVEFEMGIKRARYRLINSATYDGKEYDLAWAEAALSALSARTIGFIQPLEELGAAQLKAFKAQHTILKGYDASILNNEFVKKYVM